MSAPGVVDRLLLEAVDRHEFTCSNDSRSGYRMDGADVDDDCGRRIAILLSGRYLETSGMEGDRVTVTAKGRRAMS